MLSLEFRAYKDFWYALWKCLSMVKRKISSCCELILKLYRLIATICSSLAADGVARRGRLCYSR